LIGGLEKFLEARGASGSLVERVAASAGGSTPPPPGNAAAAELDSQPTRQVSSEAIAAGATAVTAAAADTEVPIVQTSPIEEPPSSSGSGKRLALVAAVVVLLGLAAVVTGGIFAWKSGFFKATTGTRASTPVAELKTPPSGVGASHAGAAANQNEVDQLTTAAGSATVSAPEHTVPEPTVLPKSVGSGRAEAGATEADRGGRQAAAETDPRSGARHEFSSPPPPVQPPPKGTVVIAFGETLLAGEAEAVVEDTLAQAGIPLVDENGIPGIAAFLGTDLAPEQGEIRQLLQPYARNLVLVRVEYLGERPLVYMGQQDVAFQARVIMVPIDLQAGNAVAAPVRLRVEYTHLNAQRVAEKELRRPAYRIAQLLAGR
jgi:hypothetical protein